MEFSALLGTVVDLLLSFFLQQVHWNKMKAYLRKVAYRQGTVALTFIVSNSGSHELMISEVEVELGNYPIPGSPVVNHSILPIKVKSNEMQELTIEIPTNILNSGTNESFLVVVMTVFSLKGKEYFLYRKYPLDFEKIDFNPLKLDKSGSWLRERYGIK